MNALEGYNCAIFAYGQTGSGKSYSIVGYGANKGLLCFIQVMHELLSLFLMNQLFTAHTLLCISV